MSEATLKAALVKKIEERLPGAVVLRHEELFRSGIPDISVTWNGRTTWWEGKLADPVPKGKGIQKLTATRLAGQGVCFYIIWVTGPPRRTIIVRPASIFWGTWDSPVDLAMGFKADWPGIAHESVAEFIKKVHER